MSRANEDDDEDDNLDPYESELAPISSRLQEIDPTFVFKSEPWPASAEAPRFRPLTKEDFQIVLGVEIFRCPEILLNPNWSGVDQAGLDEMAGVLNQLNGFIFIYLKYLVQIFF